MRSQAVAADTATCTAQQCQAAATTTTDQWRRITATTTITTTAAAEATTAAAATDTVTATRPVTRQLLQQPDTDNRVTAAVTAQRVALK